MSYTDSAPVSATLALEGVWLHYPDDPEGTALNLRYGKASRSSAVGVSDQESVYAGREFPVVDFGPFTSYAVSVRADVPFGPEWDATLAALDGFARGRKPVVLRDNRGRVVSPGHLTGYQEQDAETGTAVSFSVSQVDG